MQSDRYYHHSNADVEMETQRNGIISSSPRSVLTSHMPEPTFLTVGSIFSLQLSYFSLTLTAKLVWATLAPEFLNLWRIHSCPHLLKFYSLTLLGSFHVFTEEAMAPHSSTLAWKIPWMEEPGRLQSMGSLRVGHDFTFTFQFHALEKEMATCSSVLAWRIPGTGKPGGLPSMGSHRVGHDWSDIA